MSLTLMFLSKKLLGRSARCVAVLILCQLAYGQVSERAGSRQDAAQDNRMPDQSDLAKGNLGRVAASSVQIKAVLVNDVGLLVELKRWVAKEATDNGQVVEDSKLSDQAIFDRLDRDLAFRSIATRLLQRYGYLLPAPNPDSSFGKEQDLVLKERARRLVQIEAQEDNESLRPQGQGQGNDQQRSVERTTACDPQQDADCERTGSRNRLSNRSRENESSPAPDTNPRSSPDALPSPPSNRTLRTDLSTDGMGQREPTSASQIELASSSTKSPADSPF